MSDKTDKSEETPWEMLSREEKNARLIRRQMALLDTLMERSAISREDYNKALLVLTGKGRAQGHI